MCNDQDWRRQIEMYICHAIIDPLSWPKLSEYVAYWFSKRQHVLGDLLPIHTCAAVGGDPSHAIPLAAYYWLSILAARMLDDWQDGEGEQHPWNKHPALPVIATGLIGTAQTALASTDSHSTKIVATLGRTLSLAVKAQVSKREPLGIQPYLEYTISTTGMVWRSIAWAGAVLGTEDKTQHKLMQDIGLQIGMADAIFDDLSDLNIDLAQKQYTLPIQYAYTMVEHPLHKDLLQLLEQPQVSINEWLTLLREMGALTYAINTAHNYQKNAAKLIGRLPQATAGYLTPYVKLNV